MLDIYKLIYSVDKINLYILNFLSKVENFVRNLQKTCIFSLFVRMECVIFTRLSYLCLINK